MTELEKMLVHIWWAVDKNSRGSHSKDCNRGFLCGWHGTLYCYFLTSSACLLKAAVITLRSLCEMHLLVKCSWKRAAEIGNEDKS